MATASTIDLPVSTSLQRLALDHLYLTRLLASRLLRRLPSHLHHGDVLSAGYLGLMEAAHRYDPDRGVAFRHFADKHIAGAMRDWLRDEDWQGAGALRQRQYLAGVRHNVEQRLKRPATEDEIADALGISLARYQRISDRLARKLVPLEEVEVKPELIEHRWPHDVREALHREIEALSRRDRHLVYLLYYNEMAVFEAARELGLSASYASALHERTLQRLRARLRRYR